MTTAIPSSMRAWTYTKNGHHRQVLALTTIPTPEAPKNDEVTVRVAYSGQNIGDLTCMSVVPSFLRSNPSIPAIDYSGTIVALGPSTPSHLCVGMKVFGMVERDRSMKARGTLAEYISLRPSKDMVAPVPDNISLEEAACLGAAGITAFLCCKHGGVEAKKTNRVLINGASGGCGSALVQITRGMGIEEVVATCSGANEKMVKALGAMQTVDYRKYTPLDGYFAKEYSERPFDAVLDTVGDQALYTSSPGYLKENGVFVNIGHYVHGPFWAVLYAFMNSWWPVWLGGTPRKFTLFPADVEQDSVEKLRRFVAEGKLRGVIDRVVPFEDALDGLDVVASKRARGRVVVKVQT